MVNTTRLPHAKYALARSGVAVMLLGALSACSFFPAPQPDPTLVLLAKASQDDASRFAEIDPAYSELSRAQAAAFEAEALRLCGHKPDGGEFASCKVDLTATPASGTAAPESSADAAGASAPAAAAARMDQLAMMLSAVPDSSRPLLVHAFAEISAQFGEGDFSSLPPLDGKLTGADSNKKPSAGSKEATVAEALQPAIAATESSLFALTVARADVSAANDAALAGAAAAIEEVVVHVAPAEQHPADSYFNYQVGDGQLTDPGEAEFVAAQSVAAAISAWLELAANTNDAAVRQLALAAVQQLLHGTGPLLQTAGVNPVPPLVPGA